jgi:tRNA pseudouridine55 synthase
MNRHLLHGFLALDKPTGMTSRAAIDRLRRQLPRGTKIGHTGTLDPLASGVLVVCLGKATRLADYVQAMPKQYRACIFLGARSDTADADGAIIPVSVEQIPDAAAVHQALAAFTGDIVQTPPAFSALKVNGRRACDLARQGKALELAPRSVRVHRIDVIAYCYPRIDVEIACGKGTYVRSLARDVGEYLACGGLIESLRRTAVGPFTADQALHPASDWTSIKCHLQPLEAAVAYLPRIEIEDSKVADLHHGRPFAMVRQLQEPRAAASEVFAAFSRKGRFLGLVRGDENDHLLYPEKVFQDASLACLAENAQVATGIHVQP